MTIAYNDRDLSWLDFNERVLACATDANIALLDRLNFLAISASNLDEFFQVRMSRLKLNNSDSGVNSTNKKDLLVENLIARAKRFTSLQYSTFKSLENELSKSNIAFPEINELEQVSKNWLTQYFEDNIYPVLTPLAVDPAHPFPWISSKSVNLAIILREQKTDIQRFARIKVPTNLERLVQIPNTMLFIPLEKIIIWQWEKLFLGMDLESYFTFRVTRSSNYEIDDNDDLLQAMSNVVRKRQRFGEATRLEIEAGIDNSWVDLIQNEVTLESTRIFNYPANAICDLSSLKRIADIDIPELKYPKHKSKVPARLKKTKTARTDLLKVLDDRDLLIHRPYESYEETVQALLAQCARDENVLAIKQTLYRAAGIDSPIVQSLCKAAEAGKQVVALVELKARFDESANIERAKTLERSGVHVVYGKVGLKTHAKLLHIVRKEGEGLRYYSHISTGNYNPSTAGIYEDFDFFTSDQRIGKDVGDLFNDLTGYSSKNLYRELIVAPYQMREKLLDLIEGQANENGHIVLKCNNLLDPLILDSLLNAADSGARVDLIVRASIGLTPAHLKAHENIRVRSIIGRFLEHSRVYRFGAGEEATLLIGSADLMTRNLDHRVEVLIPMREEHTRRYINEALGELLDDNNDHWKLTNTHWEHVRSEMTVHNELMQIAHFRADEERLTNTDSSRNIPE